MEVQSKHSEQSPLITAIIAIIFLGLGSIYLTWQSIQHQRAIVDSHLVLSSRVILQTIESNLVRGMKGMNRPPVMASMRSPLMRDLFRELMASGEVEFVAVYGPDGNLIVSSGDSSNLSFMLPRTALTELTAKGEWHRMMFFNNTRVMVTAQRTRDRLAKFFSPFTPSSRQSFAPNGMDSLNKQSMNKVMAMPPRGEGPSSMLPPPPQGNVQQKSDISHPTTNSPTGAGTYLVVGLSAEKHLAQFVQYRRAALYQTGFVFLAAVVLWFLAFAYLRRRDESQRLTNLENFQSRLLDNMPDGLVTLGQDGTIHSANGSARTLLNPEQGKKINEDLSEESDKDSSDKPTSEKEDTPTFLLAGRSWSDFPFDPPQHTGAPDWKEYQYNGQALEMLTVSIEDSPLWDNVDENLRDKWLILIRDRTHIKDLESDLHEAKRLATIGSLAAGIAHEVRNPLSSLRGFAQLLANKLKGEEPLGTYASTMVQEADRLNRVVTDLLYLARPRELQPEPQELATVAENLQTLLRFDLEGKRIEMETLFREDIVCADRDALKQVLLNLVVNSLQAVEPEKGRIRLSSHKKEQGIWICVEDNGHGMTQAIQDQALEPFFTSKQQGTGLGLAIVQTIMLGHKGKVYIDSAPDKGSRIWLFFPDTHCISENFEGDE
ncbi:MAG: two-component system sensor histidine kinase NtrB [Desulfovibrio sp.]